MKITFLGTGTSIGVPAIGCSCTVCVSADSRNKRRRASLYVEAAGLHMIIDTPPDFRDQVLTFKVPRVDALLYTHSHTDHIVGFDDIRRFNVIQKQAIPVYGSAATLGDLTRIFPYVIRQAPSGVTYPRVELRPIAGPFRIGEVAVEPIPVEHADLPTIGFRLQAEGHAVAYVPDCHAMDEATIRSLTGLDVMILDALRPEFHPTHFNLAESIAILQRIGARRSFITHIGHQMSHEQAQQALSTGMTVPHDGLTINL
ncbi:MAG: MBL fold metallo-hydrolase [Verrucomicrobia bacterium]|nr:MBL fold metallo-hydrolase [Verrucomicrobiota bacterium]MBU4292174.1 MBL fold metallo-hydrolase [Verrucomicrobiota bacterium]MBU4430002.1 MBL fold metallo-hydrolase [Verrucomicrobiota bacterium]MCG2681618.1 MBL fold metallo-hydrolase [Kiritimatiellia bacterium]